MKHVEEVIFNLQWLALGTILGIAVVVRVAVFCYWWIVGAWEDEQCQRSGGHKYEQRGAPETEK